MENKRLGFATPNRVPYLTPNLTDIDSAVAVMAALPQSTSVTVILDNYNTTTDNPKSGRFFGYIA
jgi:hypothetical protein